MIKITSMTNHNTYYKRQIFLDEVGVLGQEKLKETKVLVIGAGGLGSPLLTYLATAGVGNISIYDHDLVDETNLHRQILFDPEDIGKTKSIIAKEKLTKKNPLINIEAITKAFDKNVNIEPFDIIIDCTDNLETKFVAHDLCFKKEKLFCVASIYKFEGQIQFFNFKRNKEPAPCMRCLWQETPNDSSIQTCAEVGVIGATAGVIGTIQAIEVVKCILGMNFLGNDKSLLINLIDFSSIKIKLLKNSDCPLCGDGYANDLTSDLHFEIESNILKNSPYLIVNLTEEDLPYTNYICSSLDTIVNDLKGQNLKKEIAVICMRGITSIKAVKRLREYGFSNSYSIRGGINSLREE